MKYLLAISLALIVVLSGCTQQTTTTTTATTSIMATTTTETTIVSTTINQTNTTTTIRLGSSCNDTDGGLNYVVKGTVTNPSAPVGLTRAVDKCNSDTVLEEFYCKPVSGMSYSYVIADVRYTCKVACYDGICVNETAS